MKGFIGIEGKLSQSIIKVVGHILHHPPLHRDLLTLLVFLWMLYCLHALSANLRREKLGVQLVTG